MLYDSKTMEEHAVMQLAQRICAAARTAPKAHRIDHIHTCVVDGKDKDQLADEMERLGKQYDTAFFIRDAGCVRASQAVVLIGAEEGVRTLNEICGFCHYTNCNEKTKNNGVCVYDMIDLGISLGSAVSLAADARVDNRILFSAGKAAITLGLFDEKVSVVMAIPLAVAGKSPYYDRK